MAVDKQIALQQIDSVLGQYDGFRRSKRTTDEAFERTHTEVTFRMMEVLRRLAPPGSMYRVTSTNENELAGVLRSLRADYEAGFISTLVELIHGDLFSDFLEMASHLLRESYKDAAAVIAGGVLEQHLRALCAKHGVTPVPRALNALNDALYRRPPEVLSAQWMKQVTAWADIRNSAAHGHYIQVDSKQVELMIAGIRHFILIYPP